MNPKVVLASGALIVGLGCGFVLGAFVWAPRHGPQREREAGEGSAARVGDSERLVAAVREMRGALAATSRSPTAGQSGSKEIAELRSELARLERSLRDEVAARQQVEGTPVPFPDGVEKPREADLAARLEKAFKAGDVPATVKAIDCSEYPCIAFAEAPAEKNHTDGRMSDGDDARRQKLVQGLFGGLSAADISKRASFRFREEPVGSPGDADGQRMVFGIGLEDPMASTTDAQSQVQQRVDYRMQQYFNGLKDSPKP